MMDPASQDGLFPYPNGRALLRAAVVLAVSIVFVYGPYTSRMGFYIDDWLILERMGSAATWWTGARRVMESGLNTAGAGYAVLFKLCGLHPLRYQCVHLIQDWLLGLLYYLALRRWLGSDRVALSAAVIALIAPVCIATHLMMTYSMQKTALILMMVSLLLHLHRSTGVRERCRRAASLALYGAAALAYTGVVFLAGLHAGAVFASLRSKALSTREAVYRALVEIIPFGLAAVASQLWEWIIYPRLIGMGHDMAALWTWPRLGLVYQQAFLVFSFDQLRLMAEAWQALPIRLLAPCALFGICVASQLGAVPPAERSRRRWAIAAGIIVVGFFAAYLPYVFALRHVPGIIGWASHINAGSALLFGLCLALPFDACAVQASGEARSTAQRLGAALLGIYVAAAAWTNWHASAQWAKRAEFERQLLSRMCSRLAGEPEARTVAVRGAPDIYEGMGVIGPNWALEAALRVVCGRKEVRALWADSPTLRAEPRGFVEDRYSLPLVYPYEGMFIYDFAADAMRRGSPLPEARN